MVTVITTLGNSNNFVLLGKVIVKKVKKWVKSWTYSKF
jgi:hypothetical protein